jgi:hypothetical protein
MSTKMTPHELQQKSREAFEIGERIKPLLEGCSLDVQMLVLVALAARLFAGVHPAARQLAWQTWAKQLMERIPVEEMVIAPRGWAADREDPL